MWPPYSGIISLLVPLLVTHFRPWLIWNLSMSVVTDQIVRLTWEKFGVTDVSRLYQAADTGKRCSYAFVNWSRPYYMNNLYVIVAPQLAEEKLREHWKSNCPDLRRLESQQMQRAVEEEWKGQIKQRQEVWHRFWLLGRLSLYVHIAALSLVVHYYSVVIHMNDNWVRSMWYPICLSSTFCNSTVSIWTSNVDF